MALGNGTLTQVMSQNAAILYGKACKWYAQPADGGVPKYTSNPEPVKGWSYANKKIVVIEE